MLSRLTSLFTPLFTPGVARLVIGASILSSLVCFGAGWTARGWLADAAVSKVELSYAKDALVRSDVGTKAIAKADTENRQVVVRYVTRTRYIAAEAAQTKEDIRYAESQADAAGQPRIDLSARWVRLYNDSLTPGRGADSPAGGIAGAPGGTRAAGEAQAGGIDADQAPSGLDQWDVLSVHAENGRRWAECRAQLNALIDSLGPKDSQTGVVTR
jgi:hypothetical protein